jgi:hypothetical protein
MANITVLMAVYDTPLKLLGQAVDSILGQTCGDFEFLIIDDENQDPATADYLFVRARADARIRLVREPHRGLTASLNRGLELARGAWIARQDADDWSSPCRLKCQLEFLTAHPQMALCGSNAWMHQQAGQPLWRTRLPLTHAAIVAAFPRGNPFVHGSTMFARERARTIGGYRQAFSCAQDYDFFWRLAEAGPVANLTEPLYHYRYTAGSVSVSRAVEQDIACQTARSLAARRSAARTLADRGPENNGAGGGVEVQESLEVSENVMAELEAGGRQVRQTLAGMLRAQLGQADHLLLAGNYRQALQTYLNLAIGHPASARVWAKLARCGVFLAMPPLREACFR